VIDDRKHFTPQHGGTALCYENKYLVAIPAH